MASGNARDVRQLAAAVGPERHCAIQRIRTAVFSKLTAVSSRRARESNVHRLTRLDGHVGQRLVIAARGPTPELERRLAHADDLSRRGRRDATPEGRRAPRRARAQLIGPLVHVPDERELRIPERPDLLREAVDRLWIRHVAQAASSMRRRRLVGIVRPAEWLAVRIDVLRGAPRCLRGLADFRIVSRGRQLSVAGSTTEGGSPRGCPACRGS